ncbi:ankyrin repeat domain-containing protein [Desulfovibrio sp. Fe33]|uniref:ankyrin repeat domain-containing protein n=1 Tax=Desulfovibrio sp. Fe33 TaxID=3020842 RepID=UPI00234D73E7|nr:ankyrin repeat domain-containing protein [Desulfovibrio sp. Fe33]
MTQERTYYSPVASAIKTFFKASDLQHFLGGSQRKQLERFLRDEAIVGHDEFEILMAQLFGHKDIRSIILSIVCVELLHEANWCRRMAFPSTNWVDSKQAWESLFREYLSKILAHTAFRIAFTSCICGGPVETPLPRTPTWFLPRKGKSAVGRFLNWWCRRAQMDKETFWLSNDNIIKEAQTIAKWEMGSSSPSMATILAMAEAQYLSGKVTQELRCSLRTGLIIASTVDNARRFLSREYEKQANELWDSFETAYLELVRSSFTQCIRTFIDMPVHAEASFYNRTKIAKRIIIEQVEERQPPLKIIAELHEERFWFAPYEEEKKQFVECLKVLPPYGRKGTPSTSRLHDLRTAPDKGGFHSFSLPFTDGLKAIESNDVEGGYDLLWEAFCNARYRAGKLMPLILEMTHSTACYLLSLKQSSGKSRHKYWLHIKKMQSWSQWHDQCAALWDVSVRQDEFSKHDLDDNEYRRRVLEIGRRRFEGLFGDWIPEIVASPEAQTDSKAKYKGQLDAIIKAYTTDNNKLCSAIKDHDCDRAIQYITKGINLNFRTVLESNAFYETMAQEAWGNRYKVAEAILSRDDNPISAETLMTPMRHIPKGLLPEALITDKGQLKHTALHMVLVHRNPILLKLLIKRGVDMNQRIPTEYGELSPLLYAVLNCASNTADRPWPGCCRDGYGTSAGAIENVKILLAEGVDVNDVHRDGMTPLFQAVLLNDIELVQLLLAHGAKTNCPLDMGLTLTDACSSLPMQTLLNQAAKLKEAGGYTYH